MKKIGVVLLVLAVAVCLFACSATKPVNKDSDTPTLDAIKKRGEIVMLTNATFPPFEYIGRKGDVYGIDADVAQEIANDLGVKLKIVNFDFDFLIDSLKSGKGNFVAAGMTVTEEREKQVDFTKKYITSAQYAVVRCDSDIDLDNISDLTFAAQEGTKGEFYAVDELGVKTLLFKTATDASQAVISGKCDIAIMDDLVAQNIVLKNSSTLKRLEQPLTSEAYAIAVAKGKEDLVSAINTTLDRLIAEGKIEEFANNHLDI